MMGRHAQDVTGWSRAQAARRAQDAARPAEPRVLAYVAAFEPWNALLHWMPNLMLPEPVATGLADLASSPAESVRLGVAVARRLGHPRLSLFDAFPTGEMPAEMWVESRFGAQSPEFQAWLAAHPFVLAEADVAVSGDYWDTLRFLNAPDTAHSNDALERDANLRLGLPGRARQADGEARNLFMAARLRQDSALHAGGRVLAIVGASYKLPMEAALRALSADLRVVEFAELDGMTG